ncbi:MAG: type II toxin-antitoxin system VapC family toxin [Spirochaetaceae bacterium]|nr:type II toxin-antitoxin system VapC family toxin [Spirochaetaceae bacterium]
MIIDTSAILAILEDEPERHHFNTLMAHASVRRMSAASYVEAGIVVTARHGRAGLHDLMVLIARATIEISPFDQAQANIALDAYVSYGKGIHPAGLNYGDCFSYALSRVSGEPLLYKGSDFAQTDIVPAD